MDIIQLIILTSALLVVDFFFPLEEINSLFSMLIEKNMYCPDVEEEALICANMWAMSMKWIH